MVAGRGRGGGSDGPVVMSVIKAENEHKKVKASRETSSSRKK